MPLSAAAGPSGQPQRRDGMAEAALIQMGNPLLQSTQRELSSGCVEFSCRFEYQVTKNCSDRRRVRGSLPMPQGFFSPNSFFVLRPIGSRGPGSFANLVPLTRVAPVFICAIRRLHRGEPSPPGISPLADEATCPSTLKWGPDVQPCLTTMVCSPSESLVLTFENASATPTLAWTFSSSTVTSPNVTPEFGSFDCPSLVINRLMSFA